MFVTPQLEMFVNLFLGEAIRMAQGLSLKEFVAWNHINRLSWYVCTNMYMYTIQTRWFKVTFLSPCWWSLDLWKGHLTIEVTKCCQVHNIFLFTIYSHIYRYSYNWCISGTYYQPSLIICFQGSVRLKGGTMTAPQGTRWAQRSVINGWTSGPYKWPYKWINGVIAPINGRKSMDTWGYFTPKCGVIT